MAAVESGFCCDNEVDFPYEQHYHGEYLQFEGLLYVRLLLAHHAHKGTDHEEDGGTDDGLQDE